MDPRRLSKKQRHAGWQTHSCKTTPRIDSDHITRRMTAGAHTVLEGTTTGHVNMPARNGRRVTL